MQRPSKWTCREDEKNPNTFFAYIVFVNRFLHLCHYKTTFCQNNLSKSEDYFWNTYSMLQKHYALWVMAKIVALLTDSSRGLAQKIREIFAKNTRKICEIFVKNTRKIYEKFAKKSQKNRKKSKIAKNLWKNREKSANFDFLRFFCDFFANFS